MVLRRFSVLFAPELQDESIKMSRVLFLDDEQINQFGSLLEAQIGCLLAECMKAPPHNMNWPALISDVPEGSHYAESAQGNWRKMREYSAQRGGGSIVVIDERSYLPIGYAHCLILTEQGISDFHLNDPALSEHAKPGDLLLTFAGLAAHYRGARVAEDGSFIFPPEGGWESGEKKPGRGLYQELYEMRMTNWGVGHRCWNRTHPDRGAVRYTGGKFGLKPRGTIEVLQAGIMTPKVILATDGPYQPV